MGVAFVRQASPGAARIWERVGVVEVPRERSLLDCHDTEGAMKRLLQELTLFDLGLVLWIPMLWMLPS
jgi:hypothetical protein